MESLSEQFPVLGTPLSREQVVFVLLVAHGASRGVSLCLVGEMGAFGTCWCACLLRSLMIGFYLYRLAVCDLFHLSHFIIHSHGCGSVADRSCQHEHNPIAIKKTAINVHVGENGAAARSRAYASATSKVCYLLYAAQLSDE